VLGAREVEWSSWLVSRRAAIERALALREAPSVPGGAEPESEALRRFRSFAASALRRGEPAAPALDGLRVDPERTQRLLAAWCEAAVALAGEQGSELRGLLEPLAARFASALTGQHVARKAGKAARVARRAVVGAIDRIADAFLAVDLETGSVVDANPAAAVLLGLPRHELVGARADAFVRGDARGTWRDELAELVESDEPRRFRAVLVDRREHPVSVEVHATRFASRERVLALAVARVL